MIKKEEGWLLGKSVTWGRAPFVVLLVVPDCPQGCRLSWRGPGLGRVGWPSSPMGRNSPGGDPRRGTTTTKYLKLIYFENENEIHSPYCRFHSTLKCSGGDGSDAICASY